MRTKTLAALMVMSLLAVLPLAAQVPEEEPVAETGSEQAEPMAESETFQEQDAHSEPMAEGENELAADVNEAGEELPKTGSTLPLMAVLGCLSLGVGYFTRRTRVQ